MITVAFFDKTVEAELLRGRLELAGIRAFVADKGIVGNNWMYTNAVGGVRVQVDEKDLDRARAAVEEYGIEAGQTTPLSACCCPSCGSTKVRLRRVSKVFFWLSLLLLGVPLALYRPRCNCLDCGKTWKKARA